MLAFPHAKINIGLYVTSRRPDGYHNLETVFYPIPLRDVIELQPLQNSDDDWQLRLSGIPVDGQAADNLVVRVFMDLKKEFDLPPLDIHLSKHIPIGAGLGGGSSDAAFMMTTLNEHFSLGLSDEEMERRMAGYGADCAFFVKSRPVFATGIGEQMTPLSFSLRGWHFVLVKPPVGVSTREAYAGVVPQPAPFNLAEAVCRPVDTWRETVANDFERSVFRAHPSIAAIKETLYDMGATFAAMSGSGSSVFALFDRPTPEAEKVFKDCFVFQQKLVL